MASIFAARLPGALARSIFAALLMLLLGACGGGADGDAVELAATSGGVQKRLDATGSTDSSTATWIVCASENQTCSFTGTQDVRYGTTTTYVTRTLTSGTPCSNAVFGDPVPGTVKSCFIAATSSTVLDPSAWTLCATENGTCAFSGTRQVRYGTPTQATILSFTGQTACSNAVFGDPASGIVKSCWYSTSATDASSTGTWTACANESGYCAFSGTHTVRYGAGSIFTTASFTGGVACTNAVFGDPVPGTVKSCSYASTVTATDPVVTTPVPGASGTNYPVILNASTTVHAGDVVSLQGENFGASPSVYFDGAPSAPLTIVNRVATNNWLAVQIPSTASGALIVRVANATGISAQVKLNAAKPLHMDALRLVPGGAFRIFGRNMMVGGSTPKVVVDGLPATVDTTRSDEYMLTATAPAALPATSASVITVDNGNGSGATQLDRTVDVVVAGSGDPFGLGVGWAAAFSTFSGTTINAATDSRLASRMVCDGQRDDSPAVQSAIDLAAAKGGGVVQLPAGTCRMAGGMNLHSNVVVQGAGKASTVLVYESNYAVFGVGLDLAGVRNLTLINKGSATEGPLLKDGTRLFIQNVAIQLGTSRQMYLTGNRHFVVAGSDFVQAGSISDQGPYLLNDSAGLVFEGNTTQWVDGAPAFIRVHDSYVHANRFTRDGRSQNSGGTIHSFVMDFAHRLAVVGNTFEVAYGPITNTNRNDGESILTEGGGSQRTENLGTVASATSTTISDPSNTIAVDPFGFGTIPENYGVAIVGGKGAGQTRRLVAYNQPTMTVDRAWDVVPDATSHYATFVWGLEKSLIKDNTLTQNPRGIWLYHTAIREVDVIGNAISEGGGIYMRSYQKLATKSFMPQYDVLISGNRISNTTGHWMSYINTVFVNSDAQDFGIATLGIEMRGNQVTANVPNVSSQTEEYAGTEGYMAMMRVENYGSYATPALPRLLGTILSGNVCTNCDVAVRIGTGAGGTTILNTQLVNSAALYSDWATTSGSQKSTDTLIR